MNDVLLDEPYDVAIARCNDEHRLGNSAVSGGRFSDARWASFKDDLRELQHLVPDDWWNGAVFDAGFNPPPSWILIGGAVSNVIPIRAGTLPSFLFATSIDALLLIACFLAVRSAFGRTTAVVAALYFGASFVASYGWNGGAFLRFTWLTAIVLSLAAMKRGRWVLAGALMGLAVCDRLFPAGFAMGALIPLGYKALHSREHRQVLIRFAKGLGGATVVLVALSALVYGPSAWAVFFSRILRHGDVYYVMHIGLKKVLTFRSWVPGQNFWWHAGLQRFHDWNLHLRATWAGILPLALAVQAFAVVGAAAASLRRRPYESALLFGVVVMFFFNLPANYYYVVLALVPAMLFRSAATAPTVERRTHEYVGLIGFNVFWVVTLIASRVWGDDIVADYWICVALLLFLVL